MNTKENLLQPEHVRRPYTSPVLQVYGSLAEVTAAQNRGPGTGDNPQNAANNTK